MQDELGGDLTVGDIVNVYCSLIYAGWNTQRFDSCHIMNVKVLYFTYDEVVDACTMLILWIITTCRMRS